MLLYIFQNYDDHLRDKVGRIFESSGFFANSA